MHPQIVALAAAERVKDMRAAAIRVRRAREARRPRARGDHRLRRGPKAAHHAGQPASQQTVPAEVVADR